MLPIFEGNEHRFIDVLVVYTIWDEFESSHPSFVNLNSFKKKMQCSYYDHTQLHCYNLQDAMEWTTKMFNYEANTMPQTSVWMNFIY